MIYLKLTSYRLGSKIYYLTFHRGLCTQEFHHQKELYRQLYCKVEVQQKRDRTYLILWLDKFLCIDHVSSIQQQSHEHTLCTYLKQPFSSVQ